MTTTTTNTNNNRTIYLESLDRHRSPSATEIYSTARTYLQNTNEIQSNLSNNENDLEKQEAISLQSQKTNNDNLEFHKSERRKKQKQRLNGHRKRTSSSETLIVEDIPPPQPTERSRSVEIIRGIDRVDFERSKTENLLTSADTSSIDTSNSYGLSANSKLMTQSLGRGQSIPSVSQAIGRESLHSNISNSQDAPPPDRLLDPLSTLQSDEASIQEYIGQTFPLVKNIDKDVVASSVAISNSVERRHSSSQPLPSQVASITRSNFHSYMQPPLSNNSGVNLDDTGMEKIPSSVGKKSRSSQKRQQPNLNGVALASLDSTPNKIKESDITQQRIAQQNFTTPPRKPMDVSQPSLLASSSTAHKEKPSHNRIIDKISLSGSNYSSRSSSPLTKSSILHIDEENKPGSTVQNAAETLQTLYKSQSTSEDKGTDKEDQFAQGNDRILREKLQEAKAMNRQETTNGAVMYQFSLWKGVQKRDPIPDISLPKRIVNNSESTDQTPIKSTKKDQVKTSSQKKSNRLRGPRAAIEAQDENIAEHSTKVDHIGNVQTTQRKLTEKKSEDNIEKKEAQSHHPTPIYPELPVTRQSEFGVRQVMSKSSKDCSEDEKSNDEEESFEHHLSGRAFAFRNMVGSCKSSNLSCGSLAETVQTEIGIPNMYTGDVVDTALSVDSLSTVDSDHDENLSVEDDAILAVAMENEYSFISNDHEEVDHISQSAGNEHVFQPNFSLELSLEAISQSADQSVEPPVIKKREKSQTLGFDEHNSNANVKNVLVSASLSKLPTHNGSTSSTHPVRRKSATSGHTQRIREMTIAAKLESPYDEQIDIFQDSQKTENSSPSLLSEASEYDTFEDSHITKNDQTITTTDDQNILSQQHQYNRSLISPEVFSSNRSAVQFQNDEIYSIHDFQWKRGSEILGEGSFGQVFKGMNCSTGELLAIKQICLTDGTEEEVATLRQEIDLMDSLKHPNIVRYVGTSVSSRYLFIVLEYVPGGSVAGMLSQFGSFSEVLIRRLVNQIMQGVDYLHQKGIIHRDIKGANVLVTDIGVAKLADFGCSKQLAGLCTTSLEESMRTIRGSVPWMAPEVIKQTGHGRSADIWSVGATIIEMATAKPPWQEFSNNLAALFHVATSKHPPPIPSGLTKECSDFIGRCMKIDPKERATAKELLMDPFLLALIVTSKVE